MNWATADLCDANEAALAAGRLRVLPPVFRDYGARRVFSGPIQTLRVFEDNVLVRQMLQTPGEGRVLIIDGAASLACALVGGNLGALAQQQGWAAVIVNGCVRDTVELAGCGVAIRALAACPRRSRRLGAGEVSVPIEVGGVAIAQGQWCYGAEDGILISDEPLSPPQTA